jgi:hypothetical protein
VVFWVITRRRVMTQKTRDFTNNRHSVTSGSSLPNTLPCYHSTFIKRISGPCLKTFKVAWFSFTVPVIKAASHSRLRLSKELNYLKPNSVSVSLCICLLTLRQSWEIAVISLVSMEDDVFSEIWRKMHLTSYLYCCYFEIKRYECPGCWTWVQQHSKKT